MRSKVLFFLLLAAVDVSAQSCEELQVVFIIGVVFGAFSLIYTYQRTQTRDGLDSEIIKKKKVLKKLKAKIEEDKAVIDKQRRMLFDFGVDDVVTDDVKRKLSGEKNESLNFSKKFWSKIESDAGTVKPSEVMDLVEKKKELERLIELSKTKYHTRQIDEAAFNDITRDYQKQLIEIEHAIKKIKMKED